MPNAAVLVNLPVAHHPTLFGAPFRSTNRDGMSVSVNTTLTLADRPAAKSAVERTGAIHVDEPLVVTTFNSADRVLRQSPLAWTLRATTVLTHSYQRVVGEHLCHVFLEVEQNVHVGLRGLTDLIQPLQ